MTNIQKPVEGDKSLIEYVPLGCQSKIMLSVSIVKSLVAIPTKSRQTCGTADALRFIAMCSARRMNPFTGDCFLQGYDTANGPKFEFITSYQALITRAEQSPEFDGISHGVIVRQDGKLMNLVGDFYEDEQELLGAWATLKRKDRSIPFEDRVKLKTFMKVNERGEPMARWKIDPGGMIVKCASASVCREAFPTSCGGLYVGDEIGIIGDGLSMLPSVPPDTTSGGAQPPDNSNPDLTPKDPRPETPAQAAAASPQAKLAALAADNGLPFDAYQRWAEGTGNDSEAGSRADWSEIPTDMANRYLRAQAGFLKGLKAAIRENP